MTDKANNLIDELYLQTLLKPTFLHSIVSCSPCETVNQYKSVCHFEVHTRALRNYNKIGQIARFSDIILPPYFTDEDFDFM